MIPRVRGLVVAVAFLACLLSGCGSDDGYVLAEIDTPTAYLRVVNAIPDSPPLRLLANDRQIETVNFGSSSNFQAVLPELLLELSVVYVEGNQLIDLMSGTSVLINVNERATVMLTGTMANPEFVIFQNPPAGSTASEEALELQFAHASSGRPDPVEVELSADGGVIRTETLAYGDVSSLAAYDPGTFSIAVRDADTANVLWESGNFELSAGGRALVPLVDYFGPGGNGVRMLTVTSASSRFTGENLPASLRFANMVPDEGPVSVSINGGLVADNLAFGEITDYTAATVGTVDVLVTPFGDPATTLLEGEFAVNPGAYQSGIVTGLSGEGRMQINIDDLRPIASRLTLSVTNAAPTVGSLNFYLLSQGQSVENTAPQLTNLTQIPSSTNTRALSFESGTYDVVVTPNLTIDILYGPERIDVMAGNRYSIFITDSPGGGEPVNVVYADDFN